MGGLSVLSSVERQGSIESLVGGFVAKFAPNSPHLDVIKEKLIGLFVSIGEGNTCLPIDADAVAAFSSICSVPNPPLEIKNNSLFLARHAKLEVKLAENVARLLQATPSYQYSVSSYADLLSDPYQKEAFLAVDRSNLSIVVGGAGTGKTYVLARIIAAIHKQNTNAVIRLAAPTGKAAQRMHEALQKSLTDGGLIGTGLVDDYLKGLIPVTLHRLLGVGLSGAPTYSKDMPLDADVVVVDEVSMLDLQMATLLFSAIKSGAKIILLGDANQLSSVDVGHVLADFQSSELLAPCVHRLVNSRRFDAQANIGRLASFVQTHEQMGEAALDAAISLMQPVDSVQRIDVLGLVGDIVNFCPITSHEQAYLDSLFVGYEGYVAKLKAYSYGGRTEQLLADVITAFDQYRILTASKYGVLGVHAINKRFKEILCNKLNLRSGVGEWFLGCPILITQNDYRLGLSNGDVGICLYHRQNRGEFEVYFPQLQKWVSANQLPSSVLSAFAMTIHKSQGSEFDHVAIVLDASAERLLSQELLYTAITRAKKAVSLVADKQSLISALNIKTTRNSGLSWRLDG